MNDTEKTRTVQVRRRVAEWRIETWDVEIPANTPADDVEDAAVDAMFDGYGEIVRDETDGYVEMIDSHVLGVYTGEATA